MREREREREREKGEIDSTRYAVVDPSAYWTRSFEELIAPDMLSSIQVLTGLEVFKLCQREVDIDTQITKMTICINSTI